MSQNPTQINKPTVFKQCTSQTTKAKVQNGAASLTVPVYDQQRPRLNSNKVSEHAAYALSTLAQKPNATPGRKYQAEGPVPSEATISPMTRATPGDYSMKATNSCRRKQAPRIIENPDSTSPPVAQKLFKTQSSQNRRVTQESGIDEDVDFHDHQLDITESQSKPIRKADNEQFHRPTSMVTAMTSCSRVMNGSSVRPHVLHQNWSANVTPFSLKDKDCAMNED